MSVVNHIGAVVRLVAWVVFVLAVCPLWWLCIPLHWLRLFVLHRLKMRHLAHILDIPHQQYVHWWSRIGLALFGVHVDVVSGAQHLHRSSWTDPPRVFVFNHSSNFDPVFCSMLANEAKFVFKSGLHLVWFYTVPAILSGHVAVSRGDALSRQKCLASLLRNVTERDNSVAIAPEGTRNRGDPNLMLPFKPGFAIVATKTNSPVVPVVFSHANELWTPGNKLPRAGHVTARVLDPIVPRVDETADAFCDRVRVAMQAAIAQPPPAPATSSSQILLHAPALCLLTAIAALLWKFVC